MSKFEQTLEKHGYTVQTVSNGLKKSIKEYRDAEKELNALKADFESADEESKSELQADIDEYVNLLEETDEELCRKIEDYIEKKPYYDAKLQHMKDKAAGKDAGASPKKSSFVGTSGTVSTASGANTTLAATGTTTATQVVSGVTNTPAATEPITVTAEEVKDEKKKSDNWILWGFLGLIGIAVGVNIMKNRE
jgi:hypothetical protein